MTKLAFIYTLVLVMVVFVLGFFLGAKLLSGAGMSSIQPPLRAMLEDIEGDMKAGRTDRALKKIERMHQGVSNWKANGKGPRPTEFMHEVLSIE